MTWTFESGNPIYKQIVELIVKRVCSGEYPLGGDAPSVRELALELAVNPNTVQRAFTLLGERGVVITNGTSGRCITADGELIENLRQEYAKREIERGLSSAFSFGLDREQIKKIVEEVLIND